jgi:ABC-type Mn2+/Zn2+ transport system permease subunit
VIGIDLAEGMVEATSQEIHRRQINHAQMQRMGAEYLTFSPASFDVVCCGFALFFFLSLFTTQASGTGTGFSGVTVLFGNILGISTGQTQTIALISAGAILGLLLIARPLLFASLDPDVAAAQGVPVRLLGLGFMVLLAVTVSEATLAAGALL